MEINDYWHVSDSNKPKLNQLTSQFSGCATKLEAHSNGILHSLMVHSIMTFKHRHNVWQRAGQASILLDTKITLAKRKNYPIQEKDKK